MKKLTANFFPANEIVRCTNGSDYLGKANITIANAIRLNGISVFRDQSGEIDINFPGFGDGVSYVVPQSKEAYAALRDVVSMAIENENHFGYNSGRYGVELNVTGHLVDEPYADARFSVDVDDICRLYGITTREVEYTKDGKDKSFTSVDYPTIGSYEKDGEMQYQTAFEGRISAWKDQEGKDQSFNYDQRLRGMILGERSSLLKELEQEKNSSLAEKMQGAEARRAGNRAPEPETPAMEPAR